MSFDVKSPVHSESLADVLERILDKGIVIAGDISVSLVGIELLSIRLRILIATVEKAQEMGISWWENDPHLCVKYDDLNRENERLSEKVSELERSFLEIVRS